jgi:hypothetical protein
MQPFINQAVAQQRRDDLQRAAACCTAAIEHGRALTAELRRRLNAVRWQRPISSPTATCCT